MALVELFASGEPEPGERIGDFPGLLMVWAVIDAQVVVQRRVMPAGTTRLEIIDVLEELNRQLGR